VTAWDEVEKTKSDYNEARNQMTAEVAAACKGAEGAGATQILVKDAHDTGRNIIPAKMPRAVRMIRGWSGHPLSMVQELDSSFDAALMIGYHSAAGTAGNPLSHTMSTALTSIWLNGDPVSEFLLHAYAASLAGVPLIFISGDQGICEAAVSHIPGISTVAVMEGIGQSTISIHPESALEQIHDGVVKALKADLQQCLLPLPDRFELRMVYQQHHRAYRASFYPGAVLEDPKTIQLETRDYMDVLRYFLFAL